MSLMISRLGYYTKVLKLLLQVLKSSDLQNTKVYHFYSLLYDICQGARIRYVANISRDPRIRPIYLPDLNDFSVATHFEIYFEITFFNFVAAEAQSFLNDFYSDTF